MSIKAAADQNDIIAQVEKLTADLTGVNAALATANASIASLTTERDKLKTDLTGSQSSVTALTTERDTLKASNGTLTTENAQLKADMADFNKRVNAELAKRGIRVEAAQTGTEKTEKKGDEKLTATERVLQAKGASSLADLEAKRNK